MLLLRLKRFLLKRLLALPEPNGRRTGRLGELFALMTLRLEGYRILETNRHLSFAEADIVAERNGEIVVVEVKVRRGGVYGDARDSLSAKKIERLRKLALFWSEGEQRNARPLLFAIDVKGSKVCYSILEVLDYG